MIRAEPISSEAFAAFGHCQAAPAEGTRHALDPIMRHSDGSGRRPRLTLVNQPSVPLPLRVARMERHPHSTQTFMPVGPARWLACVARAGADGLPDAQGLRAFVIEEPCALTYGIGIWHTGLTVLDRSALFAVAMWRGEGSDDDEFAQMMEPVDVEL